jgi:hypothetical protein
MTYRIAHAMAQMNSGIPKANSSEGSGESELLREWNCENRTKVRTTSAFLPPYHQDSLRYEEDVPP